MPRAAVSLQDRMIIQVFRRMNDRAFIALPVDLQWIWPQVANVIIHHGRDGTIGMDVAQRHGLPEISAHQISVLVAAGLLKESSPGSLTLPVGITEIPRQRRR